MTGELQDAEVEEGDREGVDAYCQVLLPQGSEWAGQMPADCSQGHVEGDRVVYQHCIFSSTNLRQDFRYLE